MQKIALIKEVVDLVAMNGGKTLPDGVKGDEDSPEYAVNQELSVESSADDCCNAIPVEDLDKTQCIERDILMTSNSANQAKKKAKKREDRGIGERLFSSVFLIFL